MRFTTTTINELKHAPVNPERPNYCRTAQDSLMGSMIAQLMTKLRILATRSNKEIQHVQENSSKKWFARFDASWPSTCNWKYVVWVCQAINYLGEQKAFCARW